MKLLLSVLLPVALLLLAAGCGGNSTSAPEIVAGSDSLGSGDGSRTSFPLTTTDALGREVTLTRLPQRIVSLAPKNTELLFAIGAGPQVVGVTSFCTYPPEAQTREQVGGFSTTSLSLEKIISLRPDLVITVGDLHRPTVAALEQLGQTVLALDSESFDDLYRDIAWLGKITGHEQAAEQLVEDLRSRVAAIVSRIRLAPGEAPVRVFCQVWDEPLLAAGGGSYLTDLIHLAGGENIFADLDEPYPQVSEEVILKRNPEVILTPAVKNMVNPRERLLARPAWKDLQALRNGRVHMIEDDLISRCGPRLVDGLEAIARSLHPERFREEATEAAGRSSASGPRVSKSAGGEPGL